MKLSTTSIILCLSSACAAGVVAPRAGAIPDVLTHSSTAPIGLAPPVGVHRELKDGSAIQLVTPSTRVHCIYDIVIT
ncbi:predicted protein [Plenodomus lingam JN3]|uniref:Predicted protein n=1 Tax=Leptosphaeria maculans (strain JN3 / isolate v23.1.3 / race Av1-4-5-6-7-8) TaxID=985895 RepID=E4ZS26_LEPMJ|nr:predicted protein [Plenodomus lingam JN3]CBX94206.1 predicted protein [Plenodomus lingam JN3]